MDISITSQNKIVIVELDGKLDSVSSQAAQDKIMPLLVPGCSIVLNMTKCTYVSSAGLRILLMVAKLLKTKNGTGVIAGLSKEINEVMEMTGFANMFRNYPTVDEAVNSVGGR